MTNRKTMLDLELGSTYPKADVYKHPFSQQVKGCVSFLVEKIRTLEWESDTKGTRIFKPKKPISLNGAERYYYDVFYRMQLLQSSISKLDDIQAFIRVFPSQRYYEKAGILENDWIRYHYGNFITTAITIYDQALLLVNAVLILGLPPRQCKDETIAKNERVINTPVQVALKDLNSFSDYFRRDRNKHIHEGLYDGLGWMEITGMLSLFQRNREPLVQKTLLDDLNKEARTILGERLEVEVGFVKYYISNLFDSLREPFAAQSAINDITNGKKPQDVIVARIREAK